MEMRCRRYDVAIWLILIICIQIHTIVIIISPKIASIMLIAFNGLFLPAESGVAGPTILWSLSTRENSFLNWGWVLSAEDGQNLSSGAFL